MMRKMKLKNLQFCIEVFGLMLDITPFRWANFAFKTQWSFLGEEQSTQLFAGPLHIWTFSRDGSWCVKLGVGVNGCVHGTFTPSGDNAIVYYWRKITGIKWDKMPQQRFNEMVARGCGRETAFAFVEGEFGVNLKETLVNKSVESQACTLCSGTGKKMFANGPDECDACNSTGSVIKMRLSK
jgi:hypothetical protein